MEDLERNFPEERTVPASWRGDSRWSQSQASVRGWPADLSAKPVSADATGLDPQVRGKEGTTSPPSAGSSSHRFVCLKAPSGSSHPRDPDALSRVGGHSEQAALALRPSPVSPSSLSEPQGLPSQVSSGQRSLRHHPRLSSTQPRLPERLTHGLHKP